MFTASIKTEWVENLSDFDIFTHNRYSAEDVYREIELKRLGGLIVATDY